MNLGEGGKVLCCNNCIISLLILQLYIISHIFKLFAFQYYLIQDEFKELGEFYPPLTHLGSNCFHSLPDIDAPWEDVDGNSLFKSLNPQMILGYLHHCIFDYMYNKGPKI